jgi:hypothetical protein
VPHEAEVRKDHWQKNGGRKTEFHISAFRSGLIRENNAEQASRRIAQVSQRIQSVSAAASDDGINSAALTRVSASDQDPLLFAQRGSPRFEEADVAAYYRHEDTNKKGD